MKELRNQLKAEASKLEFEIQSYKKGNSIFAKEQVQYKNGELNGLKKAIKLINMRLESVGK